MQYTFSGNLCGTVCGPVDEPVAIAEIRLYRLVEEPRYVAAQVSTRSKETTAFVSEKQVEGKADRLLATTETDEEGDFSLDLTDEQHDYHGEAFEIDVRLDGVPGDHDDDAEPVQVTITTHQPEWRKAEEGAKAQWDHCFSSDFWCRIRAHFGGRVICGQVTFCEEQEPVNDVTVTAYDADIVEDDQLGSAVTAGAGHFLIHYNREDYERTPLSPFINVELDHGPDLYFTIEASDGTVLHEEDRSMGRTPDREDVGVCTHVTDLCIPPDPDGPGPGPDLTETLWTGIGNAFDVPTDFDDAGYASPGSTDYALTGTLQLTGDTEIFTDDGNPAEYRFRVSDTTAANSDPALPETAFDETGAPGDRSGTVGIGVNGDVFASSKIGKAMVIDSTSSLVPISVRTQPSDLDADGWLNVDSVINRALSDAGYTRSDLRYWDDEDALMGLNTRDLAPGDSPPPDPDAGDSVDTSTDGFQTYRYAVRFEARDAVTGASLPGSGQTMNRLLMDNNDTVDVIELKKSDAGDSCDPISGQVALAYTAYHPHLDWVRIHRQRNEGSPGQIEDDAGDSTKAPLDVDTAGGPVQVFSYDGSGDPDDVANHFDVTPSDTCTYIVWMRTRRRLHDGNSQRNASRTRLIPFYYEA